MAKFHMGKQQKAIVIIGALLLVGGLLYRVFPFWEIMGGAGDEIAVKEKRIAKYRRMIQEGGGLEGELKALEQMIAAGESGLLTGKTASIAAADIQSIVEEMAKESDVEIKTVRVLKPEALEKGDYLSIPVQLTLSTDMGPLAHFLYRIETSPKRLTVKALKIRVASTRARSPKLPAQPGILVDLTIHGFLKKAQE